MAALLVLALGQTSISSSAAPGTGSGGGPGGVEMGVTLAEGSISASNEPQLVVPGGPGHVVLNGFDFKPFNQTVGYQFSAMILKNPSASAANYFASLHLPQGATITQVVAYFYDNDGGLGVDVDLALVLCNDFSTTCGTIATLTSSSVPHAAVVNDTTTTSITTPVVDLASYSYLIQANLPPSTNVGLIAVRVDYAYQTLVTMVRK
jgi:hypothetical protein